jgi:amino acid adenylation domain-containing protein
MSSRVAAEARVRTFPDRFQDQAARTPQARAVTQDGVSLSYDQLDRRSNAVARRLQRLGVGPESLVGLMVERSPEMIVALLGILKAGAAYLPLDPAFPPARLSLMVDDARPAAIVTELSCLDRIAAGATVICLDRDAASIEAEDDARVETVVEPWHRAYVIYTSGSTGKPKGVEIEHGGVANLLESFAVEPGMRAADVVLAHSTLSFDVSIVEIWLPLAVGAEIVLAPGGGRTDGRAIADVLARERVTFVQATPSLWRLIVDAGWRDGRGMTLLSGAEPLSRDLANALLRTGARVWNVYGPTEASVWSTIAEVESDGPVLIGHPIRGATVHVLDERMQPARAGTIGELWIGGAGLARGYLNRPELTAERFVADPFASEPGARLYRTGDFARARGAAGLECLGRIDHQMKIDGFRIEPAEIEMTLACHPGVAHAIVRAIDRAPGDTRLVAYVVHGASPPPDRAALTALARERLPAYMVPSTFVMIPDAPLTPTGKIDRAALPPPDWREATGPAPAPPRTAVEEQLRGLWREILGLEDIGIDDNFFDLGGRSRLGAHLFARIEREMGARLPLATLFESPTIASLAQEIASASCASAWWRCLVPIRASGSGAPLFCVHPVGGNVLAYRDLARRLGPDVPCYGLQAIGLDGVAAPLTSVETMARRYVDEIRSVQPRGPYNLCGFSFGGLVAFEMACVLRRQNESIGLLALLDVEYPDFPQAPGFSLLARSRIFRQHVYPTLQRARRHARSMTRLGLRSYAKLATARENATTTNQAEDAVFWQVAERVRKANTRAAIHYVPRRYDGRLTYFRASHAASDDDRRDRWKLLAREIETIEVAGGHSDIRLEPQVQIVAGWIRKARGSQVHEVHGFTSSEGSQVHPNP